MKFLGKNTTSNHENTTIKIAPDTDCICSNI
jgi:streptolysin S family bacteriocin protoxin